MNTLTALQNDIVNGKLSPEQIKARAQLYAQSGWPHMGTPNTTTQSDTGYTEGTNSNWRQGTCTLQ